MKSLKTVSEFVATALLSAVCLFTVSCTEKDLIDEISPPVNASPAPAADIIMKDSFEDSPSAPSSGPLYTCDLSDSEQQVTDDVQTNAIRQEIEREMKCNGSKSKNSYWHMTLPKPDDLPMETVNFVVIKNRRTCTEQRIDTSASPSATLSLFTSVGGGKYENRFSSATLDGKIRIYATDSEYNYAGDALAFRDGNNLLEVEYFGACEDQAPGDGSSSSQPDTGDCKRAKLLFVARQLVVVEPKVSLCDATQ